MTTGDRNDPTGRREPTLRVFNEDLGEWLKANQAELDDLIAHSRVVHRLALEEELLEASTTSKQRSRDISLGILALALAVAAAAGLVAGGGEGAFALLTAILALLSAGLTGFSARIARLFVGTDSPEAAGTAERLNMPQGLRELAEVLAVERAALRAGLIAIDHDDAHNPTLGR